MNTTQPKKHFLTIPQAGDYLGSSESTIRRMIASGELRAYRFGERNVRIDVEDIHAILKPVTSLEDLGEDESA